VLGKTNGTIGLGTHTFPVAVADLPSRVNNWQIKVGRLQPQTGMVPKIRPARRMQIGLMNKVAILAHVLPDGPPRAANSARGKAKAHTNMRLRVHEEAISKL
jgi:hypothetical protein